MDLFSIFKGAKYFDKHIEPKCDYCQFGKRARDGNKVICDKRGIVDCTYSCSKFIYSPLKRIPVKQLRFVGSLADEDIYIPSASDRAEQEAANGKGKDDTKDKKKDAPAEKKNEAAKAENAPEKKETAPEKPAENKAEAAPAEKKNEAPAPAAPSAPAPNNAAPAPNAPNNAAPAPSAPAPNNAAPAAPAQPNQPAPQAQQPPQQH